MKGFPVFLVGLERRRCVVIGGGAEAERKVDGLLDCDADVTVFAAQAGQRIRSLAAEGELRWIEREYRRGDLAGAFLVIAADQTRETHARIWDEAQAERCLVNAMDDTPHCSFVAGSVVRRGDLTVAISTGGAAPALAVRLRQRLERELGPEYATFLQWMAELREPMLRRFPDFQRRRALWYEIVDSEILDHLRAGRHARARELLDRLLSESEIATRA